MPLRAMVALEESPGMTQKVCHACSIIRLNTLPLRRCVLPARLDVYYIALN